ncbi:MAG: hypothetical protein ABH823_02705 [bacterium]
MGLVDTIFLLNQCFGANRWPQVAEMEIPAPLISNLYVRAVANKEGILAPEALTLIKYLQRIGAPLRVPAYWDIPRLVHSGALSQETLAAGNFFVWGLRSEKGKVKAGLFLYSQIAGVNRIIDIAPEELAGQRVQIFLRQVTLGEKLPDGSSLDPQISRRIAAPNKLFGDGFRPDPARLGPDTPSEVPGKVIARIEDKEIVLVSPRRLNLLTDGELDRALASISPEGVTDWNEIMSYGLTANELSVMLDVLNRHGFEAAVLSNQLLEENSALLDSVNKATGNRREIWVALDNNGVLGKRSQTVLLVEEDYEIEGFPTTSIVYSSIPNDARALPMLIRSNPAKPIVLSAKGQIASQEMRLNRTSDLGLLGAVKRVKGQEHVVVDYNRLVGVIGMEGLRILLEDPELMEIDVAGKTMNGVGGRVAARTLNFLRRYDPSLRLVSAVTDKGSTAYLVSLTENNGGNFWVKKDNGLAYVTKYEVDNAVPAFGHMPEEIFVAVDDSYLINPFAIGAIRSWIDGTAELGVPLNTGEERLCRSLLDLYYEKLLYPGRTPKMETMFTKSGPEEKQLNVNAAFLALTRSVGETDWLIRPAFYTIAEFMQMLQDKHSIHFTIKKSKIKLDGGKKTEEAIVKFAKEINSDLNLGLRDIFRILVDLHVRLKRGEVVVGAGQEIDLSEHVPTAASFSRVAYHPHTLIPENPED